MPARRIIPGDPSELTLDTVRNNMAALLRRHLDHATGVVIERRRQGLGAGPLAEQIEIVREPDESVDELVESVVSDALKLIEADARRPRQSGPNAGTIGPWLGCVVIMGTHEKKGGIVELARVDVRIEDPDAMQTIDTESVALVNVVRVFLRDMCKEMVGIMAAAKDREAAIAELVVGVAKTTGKSAAVEAKYRYKEAKLAAETREHEVDAEARVHRSTATKFMLSGLLEKYQPTFDTLARVWAQQNATKPGPRVKMPPRPSEQELAQVFPPPDEPHETDVYKDIRDVAIAMLRCRDKVERGGLQSRIVIELGRLGDLLLTMQAAAEDVLGEQRVGEILAWFRNPWD